MPEFIKLSEYGRSQHVFDVDSSGPFGIQKEKELLKCTDNVGVFEFLVYTFQVVEGRDQLGHIFLQVLLGEVPVPCSIVQTDVDPRLEEVVLPHDRVEEGLHVDPAILVPVELEERRGTEEMPELQGQFGRHSQEGVVI